MQRRIRLLAIAFWLEMDPIQANGPTTMQNVLELIVIYAHAARGLAGGQAFADDQAHGGPIQGSLAAFVVAHVCRSVQVKRI
jgi:hypothetical protein